MHTTLMIICTYCLRRLSTTFSRVHGLIITKTIDFNPEHRFSIKCDNAQTIDLLNMEDPQLRTKPRHVDIHHHWLRQEVQANRIAVDWLPTADMPSDGLTKMLPIQHKCARDSAGCSPTRRPFASRTMTGASVATEKQWPISCGVVLI